MIEFKNVSFSYDSHQMCYSLRDVTLSINAGEVVLFCGMSGCGKTTVSRLINGLIPNYYEGVLTGEICINGVSTKDKALYYHTRSIGSVFQNPKTQFFCAEPMEELAFACENMGLPRAKIISSVHKVIGIFELDSLVRKSLFKMSGGEKQIMACASASTIDPKIMVLDEPSSNLDIKSINKLKKMVALWKSQGKTVVIAEHRLYYLMDLVDKIYYLSDGKLENMYTNDQFQSISFVDRSKLGLRVFNLNDLESIKINPYIETKKHIELRHFIYPSGTKKNRIDIDCVVIPKNEIIAVVGDNGSGKTTFAKCLCGVVKNSGVLIDDKKYTYKNRLKYFNMVMQDVHHQLFTESVKEELNLGLSMEDENHYKQVIKDLGLEKLLERHPLSLSGGEKQRLVIASTILSKKEYIVFDEPTSGLDYQHMMSVAEHMIQLKKRGMTVIVITHDIELIMQCCTHVIRLKNGHVQSNERLNNEKAQNIIDWLDL